jgi:osmotically-inducible protein OsmY
MRFSFISAAPLAVLGIAVSSAAFAAGSVNLNEPAYGPDKGITRVVQQQINTAMDPSDQVSVATTHNIVSLHGFVNNEEQRQQAEQIAGGVSGVIGVDNHLVIGRSAND